MSGIKKLNLEAKLKITAFAAVLKETQQMRDPKDRAAAAEALYDEAFNTLKPFGYTRDEARHELDMNKK